MPNILRRKPLIAIIVLGCAIAGLIGSMIVAAQQGGEAPAAPPATLTQEAIPSSTAGGSATATEAEQRTPPTYNRFIRPDNGRFETSLWDDRPISDEAKAAEPWYDPRWTNFNRCLVDEDYDIRPDPTEPFSQRDLDALMARINQERPDSEANRQIGGNIESVPGIAGAFLRCSHWLTYHRKEWAAHGIVDLQPGDIPPP